MTDPPARFRPKRLSLIAAASPARHRPADDFLAHLAPAVAADALADPSGALRACLDAAAPADRDFALRAALASKRVWDWLRELDDWPWPAGGGPAGFENPNGPDDHLGSLPATDVARYEVRIDEIHRDLDALAVEDLKSHVLTNHIMPLSGPATPATDSSRHSSASSSAYNKMEDLTAVATGIVLQMLPTLARLSHLLRIWGIRLRVLRCIPLLLDAIQDAQVGLRSGWAAITPPSQRDRPPPPTLTRDDFEVMKRVLMRKVAEPARLLDYMLDCVEGMLDTLPDWWLSRMEAVETGYGEWVATCEAKVREVDWAVSAKANTITGDSVSLPEQHIQDQEMERDGKSITRHGQHAGDESLTTSSEPEGVRTPSDHGSLDYDGRSEARVPSAQDSGDEPSTFRNIMPVTGGDRAGDPLYLNRPMTPVEEQDELELPPLRARASGNSLVSQASTIMNGTSSQFGGALSSDPPEVSASPGVSRARVREAAFVDDSPPSSPPLPPLSRDDMLEPPMALLDSPIVGPIPEGEESMFFRTPADQSFVDDFDDTLSMSDMTSSMMHRESSSDQHLRQQISEIIESIPAKIKLSAEPPPVNLNPPDIQLPRLRKRTSKDAVKRSASNLSSALSSRTVTPSFTLSPARNPRPRAQRAQQGIKVYHLSRSTGEPPIKLFIRCVGEHGERVMVRVGGGWADLSEYLKEYASHHGRRSAGTEKARVEVCDLPPRASSGLGAPLAGSSPPAKSDAAAAESSPASPLGARKTRRSGGPSGDGPRLRPKTPAGAGAGCSADNPPSSGDSTRSRSSSRLSWVDDDSSFLGLAGPTGKKIEMSEENRAWVESIKEKVRMVSGERRTSAASEDRGGRFGELGKVGATKRLFPKSDDRSWR